MSKKTAFTVAQIVSACGGNKMLAPLAKISSPAISEWIAKNRVPLGRVPLVSSASGIPRHLIRPDRPDLFPPPEGNARGLHK